MDLMEFKAGSAPNDPDMMQKPALFKSRLMRRIRIGKSIRDRRLSPKFAASIPDTPKSKLSLKPGEKDRGSHVR
jgi:hypothetical protein